MPLTLVQAQAAAVIAAQIAQVQDAIPNVEEALASDLSVSGIDVLDILGVSIPIYGFVLSPADSAVILNLVLANLQAQLVDLNAQLIAIDVSG